MPGVVAGRLGVKGTVVFEGSEEEGKGKEWVRMYERSPRGSLGTFARVSGVGGWLRGRNSLLKEFGGKEGRSRVLVCEGGVCREEGGDDKVVDTEKGDEGGKGDEDVASSTPSEMVKDTDAKVEGSSLPVSTSDGLGENQKPL